MRPLDSAEKIFMRCRPLRFGASYWSICDTANALQKCCRRNSTATETTHTHCYQRGCVRGSASVSPWCLSCPLCAAHMPNLWQDVAFEIGPFCFGICDSANALQHCLTGLLYNKAAGSLYVRCQHQFLHAKLLRMLLSWCLFLCRLHAPTFGRMWRLRSDASTATFAITRMHCSTLCHHCTQYCCNYQPRHQLRSPVIHNTACLVFAGCGL